MIHGRPLHRSGNDIREGFVIAIASRFIERLACAVLAATLFALLASCGSGAVGGNPPANDSLRVTILPGEMFRDLEHPEVYADGLHLNHVGRPLFSERLGRKVAEILEGR